MAKITEQMTSVQVPPDLMIRANEAVAHAHEADKAGQMDVVFVLFRELRGEADAVTLGAIMFRLEALSQLVRRDSPEGWTLTVAGADYTLINRAAFVAAAKAKLHERDDRFEFDPEEFKALALDAAEAEGRG